MGLGRLEGRLLGDAGRVIAGVDARLGRGGEAERQKVDTEHGQQKRQRPGKRAGPFAPDAHARVETALGHARALCEWKGERVAVREMRKHAAWYVRGLRGAAQARTRINTAGTLEALERALRDVEAAQEETG